MIFSASVLLLCLLVGVDASAIKGRHEQLPELNTKRLGLELRRNQQKVEYLPLEHRELSKTMSQEEERREEKLEDLGQQREETSTQIKEQRKEEDEKLPGVKALSLRPHEAKPQLRADKLAAPLLASKTHQEERREEPLVQLNEKQEELLQTTHEEARKGQKSDETQWAQLPQEQLRLEQQELRQQRDESLKATETNRRAEQQIVDLRSDLDQPIQQQVRYEEPPLQQQQETQQEEQRALVSDGVKGGRLAFAGAEPYAFDYSIEGSSRRETGDVHGVVRGQYTVLNGDGSQRVVDYIADRDGFRAQINTGELGTENQQPASVLVRSSQPAAQDISLQLEGKTREFLASTVPQAPAAPLTKTIARPDNWNLASGEKTPGEPQQVQLKAIVELDNLATKGVKEEPELINKKERAPVLIAHQPIKSTIQRADEAPTLRQEPLKQEPLKTEPLKQEALRQEPALVELPAKKAELKRTPKAIVELRSSPVFKARASFESATAHRPIVRSFTETPLAIHHHHRHDHQQQQQDLQPVVHRHQAHHRLAPSHHRVHEAPPARTYQLAHSAVPMRAQLQHDRYPPPQPLNPRVSFYSTSNYDEEQPASAAGFEHPINSS